MRARWRLQRASWASHGASRRSDLKRLNILEMPARAAGIDGADGAERAYCPGALRCGRDARIGTRSAIVHDFACALRVHAGE